MPTEVLEREQAMDSAGGASPAPAAEAAMHDEAPQQPPEATSLEQLPFDRATRQRMLVARACADTLEALAESRAWEGLDPALAAHVLAQSCALRDYVARLGTARVVRASEPALLMLRRLERRLDVATEHVAPDRVAGKTAPAGLFMGDFTEADPVEKPAGARTAGGRKSRAVARARGSKLSRRERLQALASTRRIGTYVLGGLALIVASLAWRMAATINERPLVASSQPRTAFEPNEYLSDLQIFLPATFTAKRGSDMTVVVGQGWLARGWAQRQQDAAGASVYLLNRNVRRLLIRLEDGTSVVRFDEGVATWFDPSQVPTR